MSEEVPLHSRNVVLSEDLLRHPRRFVGSKHGLDALKHQPRGVAPFYRVGRCKRISRYSAFRYIRHWPLYTTRYEHDTLNRCSSAYFTDDEFFDDSNTIVRDFTAVLLQVLGDSSYFHLIDQDDLNTVSKLLNMTSACKEMYIRLYRRLHRWTRVSVLKYQLPQNMEEVLSQLEESGFITSNLASGALVDVLNFAKVSELNVLCNSLKLFKILKSHRKQDLVEALTNLPGVCKDDLKRNIACMAGHSVRLIDGPRDVFYKLDILFSCSFADYEDMCTQHNTTLAMCLRLGIMQYPVRQPLKHKCVFPSVNALGAYQQAVALYCRTSSAALKKDMDLVFELVLHAWEVLEVILEDAEDLRSILQLPVYLRKFTAGAVLCDTLLVGVKALRGVPGFRDRGIKILKHLLEQQVYGQQHRGHWFEFLVSLLTVSNKKVVAAQVVVAALNDPKVDEVQQLVLVQKGMKLANQKKRLKSVHKVLQGMKKIELEEAHHRVIIAKSLSGHSSCKSVYVQQEEEVEGGLITTNIKKKRVTYMSVEEMAIREYCLQGYTYSLHAENSFVVSVFGLVFWDILYECVLPDVFQSPYQHMPLDLGTPDFYKRRKVLVDKRLDDVENWSKSHMQRMLMERYKQNAGKVSLVNWNLFPSAETMAGLLSCLGTRLVRLLCQRMATSYSTACRGFPDLVLWKPGCADACKFVEVKGSGDSLSRHQKLWINYLINIGADVEVCVVKKMQAKYQCVTAQVK